jgi:hypothetical protein
VWTTVSMSVAGRENRDPEPSANIPRSSPNPDQTPEPSSPEPSEDLLAQANGLRRDVDKCVLSYECEGVFQCRLAQWCEVEGVVVAKAPSNAKCSRLTLTRMQHPAIVDNRENRKPVTYAGFASPCNAQQHPTAHS